MKKVAAALALILCLGVMPAFADGEEDVTRLTFPNGFKMVVKPEPGRGLVAISAVVRAGALEEEQHPGIGQMLSRTLLNGARNLSPRKLAQLADEVGGSFVVNWDPDYTEVSISTTQDQLHAAVEFLAETLIAPTFKEDAVESARAQLHQEIQTSDDNVFRTGYDRVKSLLYATNPYGSSLMPTVEQVDAITVEDLNRYVERWFVPSNMVVAVAGDVQVEQARDSVKLWFGRLKPVRAPARREVPLENLAPSSPALLEMKTSASYVLAASLAAPITDPSYGADMVAAAVLGSGKASRMFQEIREEQGLAYELGTLYPPLLYQSHVVAYVISAPYVSLGPYDQQSSMELVRSALSDTVKSLAEVPITEQELQRAKSYLVGTFLQRHQRLMERAKHLAWFEAVGLGYEFDYRYSDLINAVTLEQARESARRLFSQSAMVVIVPNEQ